MSQGLDRQPSIARPMQSDAVTPSGPTGFGSAPPPESIAASSILQTVFLGPNGIRAGWRLLIFAAIAIVLLFIYGAVQIQVTHGKRSLPFTPMGVAIGEAAVFLCFLIASWVMSRIERRATGVYGLPIRKAFGREFWQGAIFGFAALTLLLAVLRIAGVFNFGSLALHGASLARYGILWLVAFLFVGFSEEYTFRGYAQFTLTTGMGFWPTAILISACFGAVHLGNGGEDWFGALSVVGSGLLFCFLLRRSGSLWMPVGFHMAWDWAETFFYGVPDSGIVAPGHMLNPSFHGSKWLTGGSVGPEGSVFVFVILGLCWIFFHFWLPEAKYPDAAVLTPEVRRTALPT